MNFNALRCLMLIVAITFPIAMFVSCGKDDSPAEDVEVVLRSQSFNLGTHTLRGVSSNNRGLTIIYESGLGHNSTVWNQIVREVGVEHQGVAYSRGGYSNSELGPEPRDLEQLSSELKAIKTIVSPDEKVVLVGHSWGGAIIRTYAVRYPEDVAGLVFVDPSHENELILTQTEEDNIVRNYSGLLGASKESEQLIEGVAYLRTLSNLPDVPVTVLTNSSEGRNSAWATYHRSLGNTLSPGNFQQIITNTGHNIHMNEPNLVIEAILALASKIN